MADPKDYLRMMSELGEDADFEVDNMKRIERLVEDIKRGRQEPTPMRIIRAVLSAVRARADASSLGAHAALIMAGVLALWLLTVARSLLWTRLDLHSLVRDGRVGRLRWALRLNRLRLFSRRLDPNARDSKGRTLLQVAAMRCPAAVRLLLDAGADASLRDANGSSAVHYALKAPAPAKAGRDKQPIDVLLDKEAPGMGGSRNGALASELAGLRSRLQFHDALLQELGEASAATAVTDAGSSDGGFIGSDGGGFLRLAQAQRAGLLEDAGADTSTGTLANWPGARLLGLIWARLASAPAVVARSMSPAPSQADVLTALFAAGCDPLAVNLQGRTPVHVAAAEPREDAPFLAAVHALLSAVEQGADGAPATSSPAAAAAAPIAGSTFGGTEDSAVPSAPKTSASSSRLWAALTQPDTSGATPLHYVSRPPVLAALLSRLPPSCAPAALAVCDHGGATPLLAACRDGRSRALPALLSAGADVGAVDGRTGFTAAHQAAACPKAAGAAAAEALRALGRGGADLQAPLSPPPDAEWYTWGFGDPARYAEAREEAVRSMLAPSAAPAAGAEAPPPPPPRFFPIPGALRQPPVARFVGCSPLTVAAIALPVRNLTAVLQAARAAGLDPNEPDEHGATPAGMASLFADRSWHGHTHGRLGGVRIDRKHSELHKCALTDNGDGITAWLTRPGKMMTALIENEREVLDTEEAFKAGKHLPQTGCPFSGRRGGAGISGCPFASRLTKIALAKPGDTGTSVAAALAAATGKPCGLSDAAVGVPGSGSGLPASADSHASSVTAVSADEPEPRAELQGPHMTAPLAPTPLPTVPQPAPTSSATAAFRMPSQTLLRSVCMAVTPRDIGAVLQAVDPARMLEAMDYAGMTPLHIAGWLGHAGAVTALIAGKADLDVRGLGPLQLPPLGAVFLRFSTHQAELDDEGDAGYARMFGCAEALLSAGASLSRCLVGLRPAKGCGSNASVALPPHVGLWSEHPSFLRSLLRCAAGDCAAVDEFGNTMLHVLLYAGLPKTAASAVRLLLIQAESAHGGDKAAEAAHLRAFLCVRNSVGHSALSMMASSRVPMLEELARQLRGLQPPGAYAQAFPLHHAAGSGDVEGVRRQLIRIGTGLASGREAFAKAKRALATVKLPEASRTAAPAAATAGSGDAASGAADVRSKAGKSADDDAPATLSPQEAAGAEEVRAAVARANATLRRLVAQQLALVGELEAHDDRGLTPLGAACAAGQTQVARLLLTGATSESATTAGPAPGREEASGDASSTAAAAHLPRASVEGRCAVYTRGLLLTQRPLGLASAAGHAETVTLLLDCGASVTAENDAAVPDRASYRERLVAYAAPSAGSPTGASPSPAESSASESAAGGGTGLAPSPAAPSAEGASAEYAESARGTTTSTAKRRAGKGKGAKAATKDAGGAEAANAKATAGMIGAPATASAGASFTTVHSVPVPERTYLVQPCDALGLAALAGHASVIRTLLGHPAVTSYFERTGEAHKSESGEPASSCGLGSLATSFGAAAAFAAREGHTEVCALLLPLTAAHPSCFLFPAHIPARGLRVSPASYATGEARDAVIAAVEAAAAAATPLSNADSDLTVVLPPPHARWMAKHAHRALLGYALSDDDGVRLASWLRSGTIRDAVDAHTLATAVRLGSPQVAAALSLRYGLPFDTVAHWQLVFMTGCDVRKFVCVAGAKQVRTVIFLRGSNSIQVVRRYAYQVPTEHLNRYFPPLVCR